MIVVVLAVAALIALVVALLSASTWPAVAVVILALAGLVLLVRDWRAESARGGHSSQQADVSPNADDFAPDISADPAGPSSDARSDQQ